MVVLVQSSITKKFNVKFVTPHKSFSFIIKFVHVKKVIKCLNKEKNVTRFVEMAQCSIISVMMETSIMEMAVHLNVRFNQIINVKMVVKLKHLLVFTIHLKFLIYLWYR